MLKNALFFGKNLKIETPVGLRLLGCPQTTTFETPTLLWLH